ncbi:DUF418 domain-containing protein [Streptomyces sp. LaPpAH-108]|uniref:DUF418 domain-containing protein n=1 Tax=Streptomyces sp. LaPpAH-108 TaxID=1155714 RepID=UPI000364C561|nr:DUF418 domain-containing protein [Streptomyces sp. LaPpAH-108]
MRTPGIGSARLAGPDVLRGCALFGILLVNAQLMAGPYTAFGGAPDASGADRVAAWLVSALVTAKFYPLFAFLFGYSLVLQERSARRSGHAFAPRHLRRCIGLFALGAVHAVLLYPGDILMTYAVLGLVLYGLRGLRARTALRLAAGLVVGLFALLLTEGLLTVALTEPVTAAEYAPRVADAVAAHRGGVLAVLGAHLRDLGPALGADLLYAPQMLAALLAGLVAARTGLAGRRGRDRVWLRRTALRWLPLGLAGAVVSACCTAGPLDDRWFLVGQACAVLTGPALTVSYACGLLLLFGERGPAADVLAATGRLGLSTYLTQSLVLALVFTGYGLGLYDRVGTAPLLLGCAVLYSTQLALNTRLVRRFRYGPAEWLLRTVTSARRPAATARAASPASARAASPASRAPAGSRPVR